MFRTINSLWRQIATAVCIVGLAVLSFGCGSKPVDPRTAVPADSLVYLETADLGRAIEAITSNPKFEKHAKSKPDTSALTGMKVSVAVTGFQTSEETGPEGNLALNFRPRFVAVAETNAWNYQALGFAEHKLGEFINEVYGGEIELVTSDKHGGRYFTWTAQDGRKAFALVRNSLILFGNDESAIDRCAEVMNGAADSIAKNTRVSAFAPDSLASGYISADGVAQISNVAAVSLAMGAGEDAEVKSFIARVVPEIVRNSVTEVAWTSKKAENGRIEDNFAIALDAETAKVLGETIVPGGDPDPDMGRFIPAEFASTTRYNLKDPQIAWRSALLTARTKTDEVSGGLLVTFSSSLFEPYGIEDPELFLSSASSSLQTVRFDPDGEEVAATVRFKNLDGVKRAVAKEINLSRPPQKFENADLWRSEDGELAVGIVQDRIVVGEARSVERCLAARNRGQNLVTLSADSRLGNSSAVVVTYGIDTDQEAELISAISERKAEEPLTQTYTVESRFNQKGIERTTVSEFGLIGKLIARLDAK